MGAIGALSSLALRGGYGCSCEVEVDITRERRRGSAARALWNSPVSVIGATRSCGSDASVLGCPIAVDHVCVSETGEECLSVARGPSSGLGFSAAGRGPQVVVGVQSPCWNRNRVRLAARSRSRDAEARRSHRVLALGFVTVEDRAT